MNDGFAPMIHTLEALRAPAEPPKRLICPSRGCYMERREEAAEGMLTQCPTCGAVCAFRADGTLRQATAAERAWFDRGPPEAA